MNFFRSAEAIARVPTKVAEQ